MHPFFLVQRRIHVVDVLLVELFAQQLNGLAEALEMDDLALAQEADDVVDVRVVGKAQNVVIRHARLLLGCNCAGTTILERLLSKKSEIPVNFDRNMTCFFVSASNRDILYQHSCHLTV